MDREAHHASKPSREVARRADPYARLMRFYAPLVVGVVSSLALASLLVWMFQATSMRFDQLERASIELAGVRGQIIHLDEVLTAAAKLSAATGEPAWEQRYQTYVKELDAALARLRGLAPKFADASLGRETELANDRLVAAELAAFDLVRQGRLADASALLNSPAYERDKQTYARGMTHVGDALSLHLAGQRERVRGEIRTAMVLGGTMLVLMGVGWMLSFRILARYQRSRIDVRQARQERDDARRLAELGERLDLAVTAAGVGLWDWNVKTGRLRTNENYHTMLGELPQCDIPDGLTWLLHHIHADDVESTRDAIAESLEHDAAYEVNFRLLCHGGRYKWVRSNARVVERDEAGQAVRMLGQHIDIDQQQSYAEAVAASEGRLAGVIAGTNAGTWEWHVQSGQVVFNDRWAEMLGYTLEELAPVSIDTWMKVLHPDDHARCHETRQRHFRGETDFYDFECRAIHKNGQTIWLHDRGKVAEWLPDGRPLRMFGTHMEITDRKQLEADLQAARHRADAANAAKSAFLANMSHEIRTPMTAILGFADVLADDLQARGLPPDTLESVRTIQRNGKHLTAIINDILDLSKIEAGQMTYEHLNVSVVQVVEEVVSLMRVRVAGRNIGLSIDYRTPLPSTVPTDPVRLRQILTNLVGNAIKFTEVGEVTLGVSLQQDVVRFDVTDTGIGMTPEQVKRLFRAFSQADETTTRRFGGTGLGLRISHMLAEGMGGRIDVASFAGEGSTFTLRIPAGDYDPATLLNPRDKSLMAVGPEPFGDGVGERVRLEGLHILLAEDGPDNQRLVSHHLSRAGAKVCLVENGLMAVQAVFAADAAARPYDLVLMDMQMPELDGYGATQQLRLAGQNLPVIALTAHAMDHDRRLCLEAGCTDYVTKPIDRNRLLQACRNAADGKAADATAHPSQASRAAAA